MSRELYHYTFDQAVDADEIECSLLLALIALRSLHGEAKVRLDLSHHFDRATRTCEVDASTLIGRHFNRMFVGLLGHEFGPTAFRVDRCRSTPLAT